MSGKNEIVKADFELVKTGIAALGNPEEMRKSLDMNSQRLQVVHDYIKENFVEEVDFGKTDSRSKKNSLMKPGAEKVCKLFNTTPRWRMDRDTYEMMGRPAGTVCYVCEIVDNMTGNVIGEGRGVAEHMDKSRDRNKTVKNAEKCALVDAALYTFNLSSMFTQDMEKKTTLLSGEKAKLWDDVCNARLGVESSMRNADFFKKVAFEFCHGEPTTIGAIRALRKAVIDDGIYDLATGERIPE